MPVIYVFFLLELIGADLASISLARAHLGWDTVFGVFLASIALNPNRDDDKIITSALFGPKSEATYYLFYTIMTVLILDDIFYILIRLK